MAGWHDAVLSDLFNSQQKNKNKNKTMCTSNFGEGTRSLQYPGCVSRAKNVPAWVPQLKDQRSRSAVTRMAQVTGYFVINVTSVRVKYWLSVNSSSSSFISLKTINQTVATVSILICQLWAHWK